MAASLEGASEHPLGRAIVESARQEGIRLEVTEDFEAVVGQGVRARIGKVSYAIGNSTFMSGFACDISPAQADVRLAMGSGTDIAMESADIVIMHSDISGLLTALKLSQPTLKTIREYLFWAFAYNLLGIPVAIGLLSLVGCPLLNPMLAANAMTLSSISVILNALRLRRFKD